MIAIGYAGLAIGEVQVESTRASLDCCAKFKAQTQLQGALKQAWPRVSENKGLSAVLSTAPDEQSHAQPLTSMGPAHHQDAGRFA